MIGVRVLPAVSGCVETVVVVAPSYSNKRYKMLRKVRERRWALCCSVRVKVHAD